MSNYSELVSILKYLITEMFYPKPQYIRGLLGDGRGNVVVPGRPDYNFARFSRAATETFEIFNKEVSQPVDGTPVLMGEYPWQPGLFQVVGIDWAAYLQTGWGDSYASLQAHHETHEWPNFAPGSDVMNVFMRAVTPMRTQAAGSGSASVIVTGYEYDGATGTNYTWPGLPPVNLQPATPPTGSMRYMGVYLDLATNTLGVVTGSTTIYTDALEPGRPAWPRGVFPSAYVRLYGGQAAITERDIRDARRLWADTALSADELVKVSANDAVANYLYNKIAVVTPLQKVIDSNFGVEQLRLEIDSPAIDFSRVSKIVAPDGSPDPAFSSDNAGDVTGVGDITAGATAKGSVQGKWFDFPLLDTGNTSGVASHFRDNTSTYPTGWTESDAPFSTTTDKYSFWDIRGTSTETSWKYRRQNSLNLESGTSFPNILFGPLLIRDGLFTADVDYYFGMYRNNAGAIDENTFVRAHIQWDSAGSQWRIRGEVKDSTSGTQHDGAWFVMLNQPLRDLYIRLKVTNSGSKPGRISYGGINDLVIHKIIVSSQNPTTTPTWGQFWVQIHQTRGAGVSDILQIGALDYVDVNS